MNAKHVKRIALAGLLLLVGHVAWAADPADRLIPRAVELSRQKPDANCALGLAEMYRAAGQDPEAAVVLGQAAAAAASKQEAARLHLAACWRMLPAGEANLAELRGRLSQLADADPQSRWLGVFRLYVASAEQDRQALLQSAARLEVPREFPAVAAEKAHFALLTELGLPRGAAGLEVIRNRAYQPLYALRDLDRGLTREVAYLETADRTADAELLRQARDQLRRAWLDASKHLVQRLFALKLLGNRDQRTTLLKRAGQVAWLSDPQALERRLAATSEQQAWSSVIEPLLGSEVALVMAPPGADLAAADHQTELTVRAPVKRRENDSSVYEGRVEITLGRLRISCRRLVLTAGGAGGKASLKGTGEATIRGVPGLTGGVTAERFAFHSHTGNFKLEGNVRLNRPGETVKCRSCTLSASGKISEKKTLLDDFAKAQGVRKKLAMLPKITAVYSDGELPADVRYLLAMKLLRGHLTWHAAYAPPERPQKRHAQPDVIAHAAREETLQDANGWRWQPAHGGEPWMLDDRQRRKLRQVWEKAEKQGRAAREKRGAKELKRVEKKEPRYFWRIKHPKHPDLARAVKLLQAAGQGDLARRARHWLAEIRRNNTVVTMDVLGAYEVEKKGPVVVDVRNADRLSLKLYRVPRPDELVAVTVRIGEDFVYRDYGLQYGQRLSHAVELMALRDRQRRLVNYARQIHRLPRLEPKDLVHQWDVPVAELKVLDLGRSEYDRWRDRDDWDEHDDQEAEFFDDRCRRHRDRLEKSYWAGWYKPGSWQCDRLLEVPAEALREPGAYVLAVEANGQTTYAPIVVDPLCMVLRRCRDGVFVMLSDCDGKEPVAGATIHAGEMLDEALTNADGVTFAKIFAAGDRAIIAEKDGRYAVGGFGEVFEGIYESELDREWKDRFDRPMRALRQQMERAQEALAHAYTDRYVVAAYTDRPTYRPGQEVNFKLIVRHLPLKENARTQAAANEFRAGDFQWADKLQLPKEGAEVRFDVLDPKGRSVGSGAAMLNDFGTAAGKVILSSEAKVGTYTLRLNVGGMDRIVPEAFAVKYYRRPNFELEMTGLPEVISGGRTLKLHLTGRYYFGKPVAGANADVRLVRPRAWKPLAGAEARLDSSGRAPLKLKLPKKLAPGTYRLIGSLTDQSGRTVTRVLACRVEDPAGGASADGLSLLPRFVAVGDPLEVKTTAGKVLATHRGGGEKHQITFKVKDGAVEVRLPTPGWYELSAGSQRTEIFAYGGNAPPHEPQLEKLAEQPADQEDESLYVPRWINLTDYELEEDGYSREDPHEPTNLYALLDRQHVEVGGKLRVLAYVPADGTRLLFTIEGRTVVDYVVTRTGEGEASGRYHVVEIPIKRRYLPNFYLQGRIVSSVEVVRQLRRAVEEVARQLVQKEDGDGSEDPRWCRVEVIDPDARPGGQRLNVTLQTGAAKYRPGEKVDVRIKTTDLQGKPCEAEVSLAAVDQSVYSFGEDRVDLLPAWFNDPHPQRRYRRKTWRVGRGRLHMEALAMAMAQEAMAQATQVLARIAEMQQSLEQVAGLGYPAPEDLTPTLAMLGGQLPATSLPLARLRVDFRETAAWLPQLRTGSDGLVETSFMLPDSLTRYRLTGVGLTRDTDIGIGRARIHVTMPLSVQLLLPRFAVEGDRLQAVGLIHNNSERDRTCQLAWEVTGAKVETPEDARASIKVPARGSARAGLFLVMDRLDDAQVTLRASDGTDADAEVRRLHVHARGRALEVAHCGTFTGQCKLKLPAGFLARDLRISIARTDVAGGLDGLAYLIGYPYGCVEQTMSRFLPAVMAKRAIQQSPVGLPPEAAEKLPEVLAKGLQRLYNFQHPDGGWGWWEKDKSNDSMTIYVVYGLARCRNTGTPVDAEVLRRGCNYLDSRLRAGKLGPSLRPAALLAMTLAGRADKAMLGGDAKQALGRQQPGPATAFLALACRSAGLTEAGEQLAAKLGDWPVESTDGLALKLTAQIAYGAPLQECRATAVKLLALRRGHRWGSTRATAWAVEALSQMLRYDPAPPKAKRVSITIGGKIVLDIRHPDQLEKPVCRVHLDHKNLPSSEGLDIVIRLDSKQPASYTLTASGIQRLDRMEPEGEAIRIRRTLRTVVGRRLRVGDVIAVRLAIELQEPQSYLIVEDRRPAGCEFAHDELDGPAAGAAANVEFRDDRLLAFFTSLSAGRHELVYYLRAETRGTSHVLPGVAYPMYDEQTRGETGALRLQID